MLTAHLTAGHTKGTTTWTFDERDHGRRYHVAIIGGSTLNRDVNLVGNRDYPAILDDYRHGFALLRRLPCYVPLGAHDRYFRLDEKYRRLVAGNEQAFVDPAGCRTFVDQTQPTVEALAENELAAGRPDPSP